MAKGSVCYILALSLLLCVGPSTSSWAQSTTETSGRVLLLLKRTPKQRAALKQTLNGLQDPRSPQYRKWLKPATFRKQFGATDEQVSEIQQALAKHGLVLTKVHAQGVAFEVSGTNEQLLSTFTSTFTNVKGQKKTKRVIPSDLANLIESVSIGGKKQTSNLPPSTVTYDRNQRHFLHSDGSQAKMQVKDMGAQPELSSTASGTLFYGLTPGDIAVQYSLPSYVLGQNTGINGFGGVVGVISDYNVNETYLNSYGNTFGITMPTYHVIVDGADPGTNSGSINTYLELEAIGAVAPDATVDLYTAASDDASSGRDLALVRALDDDAINILLYPFQGCEAVLGAGSSGSGQLSEEYFVSNLFELAVAQGITVVTPTGDIGSAACDTQFGDSASSGLAVNGFASTPYATAVGGTDFYYGDQGAAIQSTYDQYWSNSPTAYTTLLSYAPEQAWNDSNQATDQLAGFSYLYAGGGGVSTLGLTDQYGTTQGPFPQPAWQLGIVPTSISQTARVVPDVSLFAGDYTNNSAYVFCAAGGDCSTSVNPDASNLTFTAGSGTEVSAAVFAGVMALVVGEHGAQGNANPTLYSMFRTTNGVFNDVANGTNSVVCNSGSPDCPNGFLVDQSGQPGYAALPGYDAATGLGSINVTALVQQWAPPNTSPSTATITVLNPANNQPMSSFQKGTPVKLQATVTGSGATPTGDVVFVTDAPQDASDVLTTATLTSGSANSSNTPLLRGGTYNIYARYAGDATYQSSLSSGATVTVTPASCQIALYSQSLQSGATISYGTPVSVGVEPFNSNNSSDTSNATGSIAVQDNGITVTTVDLDSRGNSIFRSANFLPGSHQLSFAYSGDPSFQSCSLNSALNFTVAASPTITSTTSSLTTVRSSGDPYTLAAVVTPTGSTDQGAYPSGTISFIRSDGTVLASSVGLQGFYSNGMPAAQAVAYLDGGGNLSAGSNSITATFVPATGSGYAASISSPITVGFASSPGLGGANLTISTADGGNVYYNYQTTLTLNASVGGNSPTGTVALFVNGTFLANMNPAGAGQWTYTLDRRTTSNGLLPLPVGNDTVLAQYSGDSANNADWAPISLTILDGQIDPDFTLSSPVDYTVTAPGQPTATFSVQASPLNQFSGSVYFGIAAPNGISCSITDHVTFAGQPLSTPLTCTNLPTTPGRYILDLVGSAGAVGSDGTPSSTPNINTAIGHDLPLKIIVQPASNVVPIINTIAGDGVQGTSGDGGPALSAELSRPYQALPDGSGHVYITDLGDCRIRRLDLSSGIITTIAGDGTCNSAGDGGLAINAELFHPAGIALDASGNLYFAEISGGNIREIASGTGIISTIASGYGLPDGVAVDSSGNVYFSSQSYNAVYKLDHITSQITTYAGPFASPQGIAVDSSGHIYVADEASSAIRRIDTATGAITVVAGNFVEGFSGDGGLATSAELNRAMGVAVDTVGNIYIADSNNNRIRKVDASTGIITTIAGNGAPGFSGDGGPASNAALQTPELLSFDSNGTLYLADSGNYRMRTITGLRTQ